MADGELFTVFVSGSPALALPPVATDDIAIVRSGVTFKVSPNALAGFSLGSVTYVAPLTGATITAASGQGAFVAIPAAAIAALTVVVPPNAVEGTLFEFSTTEDITAMVVTAAAGDSIFGTQGTLGTLGGGGGFSFRYRLTNNTWYRRY